MTDGLLHVFGVTTRAELIWVIFGLFAQFLFMMRFLVQWIASERARKSIVPVAFWYFSLAGGVVSVTAAPGVGVSVPPLAPGRRKNQ